MVPFLHEHIKCFLLFLFSWKTVCGNSRVKSKTHHALCSGPLKMLLDSPVMNNMGTHLSTLTR